MIGTRVRRSALLLICGLASLLGDGLAQESTPASPMPATSNLPSGWRFRRLLVPEELIPLRFPNYRPIRRETFEAELQRINARAAVAASGGARVSRATYHARLEGADQLRGTASLAVVKSAAGSAVLELSPCTVSMGPLRWEDDLQSPAIASGANSRGEFLAIVDRPGPLGFAWSTRGSQQERGERVWRFDLPRCPATRIVLELPPDLTPIAPHGVIQSRVDTPTGAGAANATPTVTWEMEFGGHHQIELRVVPRESPAVEQPLLLRESTRYRLTTSGLELRATFQLASTRATLDRLRLEFSPGLHLASAQVGDRSLGLATTPGPREDTSVEVILDEPLVGNDRQLVVLAYAPLVKDAMWELPRVRPAEVVWQEGQATVEVPEPLSLATIQVREGTETRIEPLPAPENGELRQLQFWSPRGTVAVQLSDPPAETIADIGTTIRISELAATAKMVVDLRSRRGATFEVRGLVAPGWTIDSVQSDPAEVMESFSTSGVPRQTLAVRLRHAIPSDETWRLTVRAHRRAPRLDQPVRADAVRFIEFQELQLGRNLLALGAEPPLRLTMTGDETLERLTPDQLTGRGAELVTASSDSVLFADQLANRAWGATLSREQPRFNAQVHQAVEVGARQVVETIDFRCEPQQSFVSRLLVHFSRSDLSPWEWKLVEPGEDRVATRLVNPATENSGESWELVLSRPRNTPFAIQATRRKGREERMPVTFASLPEATSQTGFLQVHANSSGPIELRGQNLQAMAPPLLEPARLPTLRGAYRFSPSQDVAATLASVSPETNPQPAWVWRLHNAVRCDAGGEMTHEARLYVENTGAAAMTIQLPSNATLLRVAVDHGVLGKPPVVAGVCTIPLPAERRFPLVTVTYRLAEPPLRWAQKRTVQGLQCDLPCLRRETTCWLPTAFAAAFADDSEWGMGTWDERLLGHRIWRREARPFDLLRRQDWLDLVHLCVQAWNGEPSVNLAGDPGESPRVSSTTWSEWTGVPAMVGDDEANGEWTRVHLGAGRSRTLWIYRQPLASSLAWGFFLILLGLGAGTPRVSRSLLVSGVVLLACGALIAPWSCVEWFRAGCQGLLLGAAWRPWLRRADVVASSTMNGNRAIHDSRSFTVGPVATGAWLGLLLWVGMNRPGWAQEANATGTGIAAVPQTVATDPGAAVTVNVLSPVDEKQNPRGDYVFVPQSLYDLLYRPMAEGVPGGLTYWLESAQYEVTLAPTDEGDPRLFAREFVADWTLRAFESSVSFSLPWNRDRLRIVDAAVDGKPVSPQWNATGTALQVRLEGTGQHRLRLSARPLPANAEASGEFSTPVPACPRSTWTVRAAGQLDRIELPLAMGAIRRDDTEGTLISELGASPAVAVRWTSPVPLATSVVDTDVAELLWLYVQSNSLVLHGKFRISARNGTLSQVSFLVDRRLQLLPLSKEQPVAFVDVQPGSPIVRCWLERPMSEVTLDLSFAMSGNGGYGHWQLPQVATQGTRRAPAWLGLTVTEGLDAKILANNDPQKVVPSEFLMAWGEEREPPQRAMVVGADASQWQIAVQPVPAKVAVEEQQDVLLGAGRAAFRYEAVLSADLGRLSQLRLATPAKFEPENVIVLHDDTDRLLRWAKVGEQELSIFFTAPLAGHIRVLVEGSAALPRGPRTPLGLLAARDIPARPRRVNLFREDAVRVAVQESPGLAADPQHVTRSEWGRFVGSYLSPDSPPDVPGALLLTLQPNQPQATGTLVTEMLVVDGQWRASAELHLQLQPPGKGLPQTGTLDTIRIHVPEEWSGPIQLAPPMEQQLLVPPGERGRLLVARLPAPIDRELKVTLTGELAIPEGAAVRVPELRVLDVRSLQRYVVLPTRLQRQKSVWETSGMQSAELPPEHARAEIGPDVAVYRVVGPRSSAVLREVERVSGTPQLVLADYQLGWSAVEQRVLGTATFYLEPARLSAVDLKLPEGATPLHFRVAGVPVTGRLLGPQHWRIPLGPELLPQLVEVLYESEGSPDPWRGGDYHFAAPLLDGITAVQTVWTVQSPLPAGLATPWLKHTEIPASQVDAIRFRAAESLRKRGLELVSQAHPLERDAWRSAWDRRLRQLDPATIAEPGPPSSGDEPLRGPTESDRFAFAADLTLQWGGHQRAARRAAGREPLPATAGFSLPETESGEVESALCTLVQGEAGQLRVRFARTGLRHILATAAQCLLVLAAAGTLLALSSWLPTQMLWRRDPHLVIALVGFAWWLCFTPSVLGLVVMALGAISACRSRWRLYGPATK